jgi:hypothetical protein
MMNQIQAGPMPVSEDDRYLGILGSAARTLVEAGCAVSARPHFKPSMKVEIWLQDSHHSTREPAIFLEVYNLVEFPVQSLPVIEAFLVDYGLTLRKPRINTKLHRQALCEPDTEWCLRISAGYKLDWQDLDEQSGHLEADTPLLGAFVALFLESARDLAAQVRALVANAQPS